MGSYLRGSLLGTPPDRYWACDRKVRYRSKGAADAAAKRMRKAHYPAKFETYRCTYCAEWHVAKTRV